MNIKKILQVTAIAVFAIVLIPSPAYASGTQIIQVEGAFETQQPIPSPLCDGFEDCIVDDLTGDLLGTNRLITVGFQESTNYIVYEDDTQIINQYGTFDGKEYGIININTGHFNSVSYTTSNDGCGSKLTLFNDGQIDLETLEDVGTYSGVLKLKEC